MAGHIRGPAPCGGASEARRGVRKNEGGPRRTKKNEERRRRKEEKAFVFILGDPTVYCTGPVREMKESYGDMIQPRKNSDNARASFLLK